MKNILLLICLIFFAGIYNAKAQFVYPNDVCSGAMSLVISNSSQLQDTLYLTDGFADPSLSSLPLCNGSINAAKHDLWYTFTATDTTLSIVTKCYSADNSTVNYQLFSGSCGVLTSLSCYSPNNNSKLTGLVIGQQYYLRSYYPVGISNDFCKFSINLISRPVNDDCADALELPIYSAISEGRSMNRFTNDLATKTVAGCVVSNTGWTAINDIWFKFTASATTHPIYIGSDIYSTTKCTIYSGNPGNLTSIGGFNFYARFEVKTLTNLIPGSTYYIRIGAPGIVDLSIGIYKEAPDNDDCINADTVFMSSSAACEKSFLINNRFTATNSNIGCISSVEKDLWFTFKATATAVTVRSQQRGGSILKTGLLTGSCGTLTCLANSNNGTLSYSGLIVGNYYYLQCGGTFSEEYPVTICITPKNLNDECSDAITLAVKPYNQLRNTVVNLNDATQSMLSCNGTNFIRDLWYKFTATDTACIVTMDGGGYFQVFEGDCAALNSIYCSGGVTQPQYATEQTEKISGLTAGTVYYLRIYPYNVGSQTLYTIDINALPANDECEGATTLQTQQGLDYEPLNNNGILYASQSLPPCIASTSTKDIWYQFTANATSAAILSNRETGSAGNTVLSFELYSGSCGGLTSMACFSQGTVLHKAQSFTNLIAGQNYYIRQYGNFEKNRITIVNAPVNDEMIGAIKLSPAPANVQSLNSFYTHGASKKFGKLCAASSNPMNHDVWFYFIAEAASHSVSISTANTFWPEEISGYFYTIEAFRGYGVDSLSLVPKFISCANNNSPLSLTGLNAGDTVYLRVANNAAAGNTSIFSVKITSTQNMNEPDGALLLSTIDDYQFSVSTAGATQSLPAAGCLIPDFADDDIWFKFTAAAAIKRIVIGNESRDVTLQLFSGIPGNLTALQCSNNIMLLPATLVNGTQYYLRVYSKANAQSASFRIGLFDEATLSANDCINDISLLGPNLIANPRCESEETYLVPLITRGTGYPGKKLAKDWWSTTAATSDAWNADYPQGFGNVPDGAPFGLNKIPRSGKGMLGLLNESGWTEYVTGKLTQPLVKGKTYFISFYINFADNGAKETFNIGAFFSNDSIRPDLLTDAIEVTPHVAANGANLKSASGGWRNICGYFTADKIYSFITVGNFGNSTLFGNAGLRTYFFLDDVTVAEVTNVVLPLNLLNFNGRTNAQQQTELNWQTANEVNTKTFEVQWRTDAATFATIGNIAAKTGTYNSYDFLHHNPSEGNNYYRLKMFDVDGSFTYSAIVKTGAKNNHNNISVNPNPVSSTLNISLQADKDELVFFRLINNNGSTFTTKSFMIKKGSNAFSWDIKHLAAGTYFITSTNKNFKVLQVVKQ